MRNFHVSEMHKLYQNPPVKAHKLSMQQIIDCDKGDGDLGCEGGDTRLACNYGMHPYGTYLCFFSQVVSNDSW